jgi:hypothetical protein
MEGDFTFDSMLKEIKKNLDKYENIIKEIETYYSKKKLAEAETIKKKIAQKIKMVKTISRTEEDNFMLDSYIDLNSELNKRLDIAIKRKEKNNGKNNFKGLLNSEKEKNIDNLENITFLDDEQRSLKNMIKMSTEITDELNNTNEELENQGKRLDESNEKVIKTLQKMPIIGKIMGEIKYYQIREKIIIGVVVGIICFILLYITFHKRS